MIKTLRLKMNLIKDIVKTQKASVHLCPLLRMVSCQTDLRTLIARISANSKKDGKLGTVKESDCYITAVLLDVLVLALDGKGTLERTQSFL